jgi:hypothetical protein
MNYCSIEDAWGKPNKITEQFNNYMNEPVKESFTLIEKDNTRLEKVKKHLEEIHSCDEFLNHFRNCRKCYNRVKNSVRPNITEQFEDLVDDNRESIVLILTGIAILLFFNLVNNVTKNN